ncbi:MAG: type II secretion system protein GspF [Desulfobacteraceae bacterium]|nr:type II secretion system protein GspF [Desulfobacteraceae bacterium]
MPVYDYTALNPKGKTINGIIDADGLGGARQKIRSAGNYPTSITELKNTDAARSKKELSLSGLFSRVRPAEVAIMTRQLSTLLGAGFPLVSAIDSLLTQTKSQGLAKTVAKLKDDIVEGSSFAAALSQHTNVFTQLFINMVRAGESSGTLEIVLDRLADITEKQQALLRRIQAALAYPILMSFIGSGILIFLLVYIVPSITSIFTDMDRVLPTPTRLLIYISGMFKAFWWVILLLIIGMLMVFRSVRKTTKGRQFIDRSILKLPLAGNLVKKIAVSRFSRTLGSLLENGVPMLKSLEIVKEIVGNVIISDVILSATGQVEKGQGLGNSIAIDEVFPSLSVQMIQVGEQSGQLESMLMKVADVYENEVESTIMSMTALLEPVMILVMAVVVGFIVLSICLPIFEMSNLVS